MYIYLFDGSNKILKLMNRKHTVEEYLEIINKLKNVKPNIKFSSDFIIGYPGETYNDYKQTVELMKNVKFINSFSFIYSARPGTPASNLSEINEIESKKRLMNFQTIAEKIKTDYKKSLIDKIVPVLFENEMKTKNEYFGRDDILIQ